MKLCKINKKITFKEAASLFNSFTTAAKASELTPFSHILTKIDKVYLSRPQFKIYEISYKT